MLSVEAISLIRRPLPAATARLVLEQSGLMPRSTHPPWLHRLLFRPDELSQPDGSVSMVDVMIGIQHQGPTLRDASVR